MTWRMIGKPFATADMVGTPTISQKVLLPNDCVLKAVRAGVIQYANPAWTNLTMKIYSDRSGVIGKLLHTSTTLVLKAAFSTLDHAYKETYFDFDYPVLKGGDSYHFVLSASGYTGNDSAHLAWRTAYPDPVYRTGFTPTAANADNHPLDIHLLTSRIRS